MSQSFDAMTLDEQKAWWMQQAHHALGSFKIEPTQIEWLSYTHNAVFLVTALSEKLVLRLQHQQDFSHLLAEAKILSKLGDTQFNNRIPAPRATYQSDEIVALLTSYLEGTQRSADNITPEDMVAIGQFLATLHDVPLRYKGDDQLPHLDWVGFYGEQGIYNPGAENMHIFTGEQLEVMTTITQKVRYAMNELNQEDMFGLIHGDLLLKNILFHEGSVRALDFEFCGWGYYLYDLTPVLWQLKPHTDYDALARALWQGYTAIRPLTERHSELLETFIVGRQVASMRWVAANQHNPAIAGKVEAILAQRTSELEDYLTTNVLQRR